MIIVLEGPDGSGKTTLAKQLAQAYNLDYNHEGPPPSYLSALDHYGRVLEDLRNSNVVLDRFALGERVYGPLLRGEDKLKVDGWKIMRRLLHAVDAFEIMCLPSYDTCLANWSSGKRPELIAQQTTFKASYDEFAKLKDGEHFLYDYTDPNHWRQLNVRLRLHDAESFALPKGVVGAPAGRYLFVGEKGSNINAHVDLPFWATVGSSQYLNYALEAAGYRENEFAMVNAQTVKGLPNYIPGHEKIIALGDVAESVCKKQGQPCVKVPHPQYWKRFHSKNFAGYVQKLKDVR